VDEHALRVLEFDKVLAHLARLTAFSAGRDLAMALTPSPRYEDVIDRQELLAEAVRLRSFRTPLNLNNAADVRPALAKASLSGVLDAQELLAVAATQRVAHQAKAALARVAASLPRLGLIGASLVERQEVVDEVAKAIDQRGEILDGASPALAIIRRDIKIAHDRLHSKLQEFLGSSAGRLAAQEAIVTLRDGRYVVPIKSDFRGEVRGIVHDVSASGATLFVEPLAVVDLANTWRELQIEEQREVERILRHLSAIVGGAAVPLESNLDLLAHLDVVLASARLAEELTPAGLRSLPDEDVATSPSSWLTRAPGVLELREARHPLLASPVPISLRIGGPNGDDEQGLAPARAARVLLITGPNTGGKTVALKTIGLLCLMAQAGLPVPAGPGSRLPVFEEVLADIGDEQSIEQSLSTFSGHLKNVISLLERVGPGSLVLLDELAAGTDPAEGAALARALLQHLLDKGALTVATTHHGELKLFAHSTPGIANAAVEFDPQTLSPTYHITVGVPGRSNALAIAARLGLPETILRAAQSSIAPEEVAIDSLLSELHEERAAAAVERRAEAEARRRAEQARARVEERLAGIDEERAKRLDDAALALEAEVEAARAALTQVQRLVARQAERRTEQPRFTVEEITEAREAVAEAATTASRIRKRSRRRRRVGLSTDQIKPGAEIWVQGIPMAAEALSAPDRRGEIDISFGGLRARVGVGQVVRVGRQARRIPDQVRLPQAPSTVAEQIEVRGQTLDEAMPLVEKFIDDGFRAGVPRLRVVHGKGTGKMRQAVRDLLAKHPLVKHFDFAAPAEGGEGVTVIEMAIG
jgi:DNA mismatch repair protein MutS2